MDLIPSDILIKILENLDPFTLCQFAQVSKHLTLDASQENELWRNLRGITKWQMKILAEFYERRRRTTLGDYEDFCYGELKVKFCIHRYHVLPAHFRDSEECDNWLKRKDVYESEMKAAHDVYHKWLLTLKKK